jgi:protoporphyrinogen oxidase
MPHVDVEPDFLVLGAGPAGLSAAWRFEELRSSYLVLEAAPAHGGNARTLRFGEFLFDTGPHRFHDRDPKATRRVEDLLGPDLHEVDAPSRIFFHGRFVDFPLRPRQALLGGGVLRGMKAVAQFLGTRMRPARPEDAADFGSWALSRFGRTVAESFLIPFSEKLWGLGASELSPDIAGRRLPGFRLGSLLRETLFGARRADHLEGRFLYPRRGYGQIVDAIAGTLGPGRLRCGSRVTRVETKGTQVTRVRFERDGAEHALAPAGVVSTLPITLLARMLDPAPPGPVLEAAARLRFRDMVLVTLLLDQDSVSEAACTYFPDPSFEFSRAHEPRVRSRDMSPAGRTSLVVEFPCFEGDGIWTRDEGELVRGLVDRLDQVGLISRGRVAGSTVTRLRKAYPVYARDYREHSATVLRHLGRLGNLETIGRGGSFFYGHVHDFISAGAAAAERACARSASTTPLGPHCGVPAAPG